MEKPVPLTVICEIVTFALPVFVTVTFWVTKMFKFTLPKLTPVGLAESVSVTAFTVSVAALLVTVPAVFVTTTRNVDPLSEVVVTGVV